MLTITTDQRAEVRTLLRQQLSADSTHQPLVEAVLAREAELPPDLALDTYAAAVAALTCRVWLEAIADVDARIDHHHRLRDGLRALNDVSAPATVH